ncbi:MAG TPA: hypothetical protein VFT95_09300 [Micromonosporaceae bacterium]|nr:hypothetical protein [Micromonosporaceae bacterium]
MSADTTGTGVKVTTVKITEQTRFRLAQLAEEAGTTIKDLIAELAASRSTAEEIRERTAVTTAYLRAHLVPDFDDADLADGARLWRGLADGTLTAV